MNDNDIRLHFKALFKEMAQLKTNLAEDALGDVWALGKWYGFGLHFRKNFGHWSEQVLEDWMIPRRIPFKPYQREDPPTDEEKKWAEFYQKPIGDSPECQHLDSSVKPAKKKSKN